MSFLKRFQQGINDDLMQKEYLMMLQQQMKNQPQTGQMEANLLNLVTPAQQRFPDTPGIHNARLSSPFSNNNTYAHAMSQYIGDSNLLEAGLIQLDDAYRQEFELSKPTLRDIQALDADRKRKDIIIQEYDEKIKKLSESPLNNRLKVQKFNELKQQYDMDKRIQAIKGNYAIRMNYGQRLQELMEKEKVDKDTAAMILRMQDEEYNNQGGIGDTPNEFGGYNSYNARDVAHYQDVAKFIDDRLSGWAADSFGSDISYDSASGMYILTNKQSGKKEYRTPQEITQAIAPMMKNDPMLNSYLVQQAQVNAFAKGTNAQDEYMNLIMDALNYAGAKGGYIKSESGSSFGMQFNPAVRFAWELEKEKKENYTPVITTPGREGKAVPKLSKDDFKWTKGSSTTLTAVDGSEYQIDDESGPPNKTRYEMLMEKAKTNPLLASVLADMQSRGEVKFAGDGKGKRTILGMETDIDLDKGVSEDELDKIITRYNEVATQLNPIFGKQFNYKKDREFRTDNVNNPSFAGMLTNEQDKVTYQNWLEKGYKIEAGGFDPLRGTEIIGRNPNTGAVESIYAPSDEDEKTIVSILGRIANFAYGQGTDDIIYIPGFEPGQAPIKGKMEIRVVNGQAVPGVTVQIKGTNTFIPYDNLASYLMDFNPSIINRQ